jgi:glycosyltransferase involved in cell wall biosynthesis
VRVALVLEQCLAPVPGGTGRYSRELARALAVADADSVSAWTAWHADVSAARVPGVRGPRRLPLPRRPLIAAWERGIGPAPREADVVHAPTLLLPPRRGRPLVVTIHDAVPWTHPETLTPRGVRFHRRMAARAAAEADLVVVPTDAVRRELEPILDLAGRIEVVGEGVAPELAVPPDADARARRLGLPPRYVVSLATLEPRKGLNVLVAAMAAPEAPRLPLVVAGQPGWGGVDLPAAAAAAGLPADRLLLTGRLGDADLAVVLGRASALVVPSRAEGFGLPVLEGMALGTPVVVSDAPALVEVAGGAAAVGPVGDVAALASALAAVTGDEAQRTRLVAAGRVRARQFSWARAAETLWSHYRRLGA